MSVTIGARIKDPELKKRYRKLIKKNYRPDEILKYGILDCEKKKKTIKTERKIIDDKIVRPEKRVIINPFKNTFQQKRNKRGTNQT